MHRLASFPGLVLLVVMVVLLFVGLRWANGVGQGLAHKLAPVAAQER